jgi:hypothetical protein
VPALRGDAVELVEEEDTGLGGGGALEEVAHLWAYGTVGVEGEEKEDEEISNLRILSSSTVRLLHFSSGLTLFSLAPMYLLSSSGPFTLTKFAPHSFATALANIVLPHPG